MRKNFLAEYVSERLTSVSKNLIKYQKRQKQAQLHNLRVEIKKLRATFLFIQDIFPGQRLPQKALKKLYTEAGLLRELHINLGLAKSFQYPEPVLAVLKKNKRELAIQFQNSISGYFKNLEALSNKTRLPALRPGKKQLTSYFDRQIWKAKTYLKKSGNRNNMHLFRQKVKEIMYVYAVLSGKMQKQVGLNEKYLNRLQLKAGKWHDTFAAKLFFGQTINKPENKLTILKALEAKQLNALLKYCRNFGTRIYA